MSVRRLGLLLFLCAPAGVFAAGPVTLERLLSAPFPTGLSASPTGGKFAWVLNERGARNIWVASPPDYRGRRVTGYRDDDGQEIAQLAWTPDAASIVYVRGGDFEFPGAKDPNPSSMAGGVSQDLWIVPADGGAPRKLCEGRSPLVAPDGRSVTFIKQGDVFTISLEAGAKPEQLFHDKGSAASLRWSPDGKYLAFVSERDNHSFVVVYDATAKKLVYLDPSVDSDSEPVWSPDSKQVAFLRIPASTREFAFGPVREAEPWSIRAASAVTGKGRELWRAHPGRGSAFREMVAENQLLWGAGDRLVFPWEETGWLHLYSLDIRTGAVKALNTPGQYEVEHVALGAGSRDVLFSSNQDDIDRRHLWSVPVAGGSPHRLTTGDGIEWSPTPDSEGKTIALLCSSATQPAHAAILENASTLKDLAPEALPADFPSGSLVTPRQVIFSSADGLAIHGQLFLPPGGDRSRRHPAVVFFHGGSRRQMLLGWHYMRYYSNSYAMNQYLASLGYVVLSVNYRSGIGYGLDFREAVHYGATGASEYNDVQGAGVYLRTRSDVDPDRIGLWGGSYGGYLTALGLARASDLFAAGVDFHGVHDWNLEITNFVPAYDPGKDQNQARVAFESSPLASVSTWRSPVLLIHGDDDRNVPFMETIKLVEALRKRNVPFEQLIIPDEIHDFLRTESWLRAYEASAAFLGKYLKPDAGR
jgi:dipeptidyl aminopeptidase/acylaminoacyl peptidase